MIKLKRAYEEWNRSDGFRILVDRLWPRGVSKKEAHLDLWLKDVAPSNELRKWFGHDPKKWEEFKKRYINELKDKTELLDQLKASEKKYKIVTLIYGAKETEYNEAVVLAEILS